MSYFEEQNTNPPTVKMETDEEVLPVYPSDEHSPQRSSTSNIDNNAPVQAKNALDEIHIRADTFFAYPNMTEEMDGTNGLALAESNNCASSGIRPPARRIYVARKLVQLVFELADVDDQINDTCNSCRLACANSGHQRQPITLPIEGIFKIVTGPEHDSSEPSDKASVISSDECVTSNDPMDIKDETVEPVTPLVDSGEEMDVADGETDNTIDECPTAENSSDTDEDIKPLITSSDTPVSTPDRPTFPIKIEINREIKTEAGSSEATAGSLIRKSLRLTKRSLRASIKKENKAYRGRIITRSVAKRMKQEEDESNYDSYF